MRIISMATEPFHEMPYRSSGGRRTTRFNHLPFYLAYVDKLPDGVSSIVVASDLQGRESDTQANRLMGAAVAEELSILQELEVIPHVNLVALAGDLYDCPDVNKLGSTGNVTEVWQAFAERFPLVIGVHGNHDMVSPALLPKNAIVLDGQMHSIDGITVSGVSGIIGREGKNQRKSPENYTKSLRSVLGRNSELLLMHPSPRGVLPEQRGDELIRDELERKGNHLVVCGHCAWQKPLLDIGGNQILNVDGKVCILIEHS